MDASIPAYVVITLVVAIMALQWARETYRDQQTNRKYSEMRASVETVETNNAQLLTDNRVLRLENSALKSALEVAEVEKRGLQEYIKLLTQGSERERQMLDKFKTMIDERRELLDARPNVSIVNTVSGADTTVGGDVVGGDKATQ